ncbi:MAG: hypothetical protein KDC52_07720 [Ignavibacteriae bacterium]|nr:hypothetical protein [Ignavibacteriota bacterium]
MNIIGLKKIKNNLILRVFGSIYRPGHYYSTIPNINEVYQFREQISNQSLPDCINLCVENQLNILKEFDNFYHEEENRIRTWINSRYTINNNYFIEGDANILFGIIKKYSPKRIIEIGSGFSSALMLDINQKFYNNSIELVFIEPYPEDRLNQLIYTDDKCEVIKRKVQNINPALFSSLKENDILFIDSSHVSKMGSDLNFILNDHP